MRAHINVINWWIDGDNVYFILTSSCKYIPGTYGDMCRDIHDKYYVSDYARRVRMSPHTFKYGTEICHIYRDRLVLKNGDSIVSKNFIIDGMEGTLNTVMRRKTCKKHRSQMSQIFF